MTVRVSHEVLSATGTLIGGSYERVKRRSYLEPFLSGILCALISFYWGLLYGSVGFAYGGVASFLVGYYLTRDTFTPIEDIIMNDLDPEQREELHLLVLKTVRDSQARELDHFDYRYLLSLLLNAVSVQQGVLNAVELYLIKENKLETNAIKAR